MKIKYGARFFWEWGYLGESGEVESSPTQVNSRSISIFTFCTKYLKRHYSQSILGALRSAAESALSQIV